VDPPRAASASVLEVLLAVEVPVFTAAAGGAFFPEVGFACVVAVEDVALAAFFVV